jgi:NIPSNAP
VITCFLRYEIDPAKIQEFEHYGRLWIGLVNRLGGNHHGYFLPSESANDIALALFTFPSLSAYEAYRQKAAGDPECQAAIAYGKETGCVRRWERSFFRPVL